MREEETSERGREKENVIKIAAEGSGFRAQVKAYVKKGKKSWSSSERGGKDWRWAEREDGIEKA